MLPLNNDNVECRSILSTMPIGIRLLCYERICHVRRWDLAEKLKCVTGKSATSYRLLFSSSGGLIC